MRDIGKVDLSVHLFDHVNSCYLSVKEGLVLDTSYHDNYMPEHERQMINIAKRKVLSVAFTPGAHLIYIAHSPINKGIVHPNTKELIDFIIRSMPDFKYTFMQYSLEKDIFKAKIKPRLEKNPIVNAWGEKTTGCVLDDLLNFFSYMDMDFTFEDIYTSLKPESSVDFKGGYPRPWETITMGERYSRVKNYKDIIMRRVELKKANGNQSS